MAWTVTIHKNAGIEGKPYRDYQVSIRFSNRFAGDKAYLDTDRYLVVLDGYLFNAGDLRQAYRAETTAEALVAAYEKNGINWLNELRGSYNGLLYDKQANLWTIFVDPCGDRPLFYYQDNEALVVAADYNDVVAHLKQIGKTYQANEKAAYSILTYGYMIDAATHIAEIARLLPGKCLDIRDGRVALRSYFRFENTRTIKISFDEAIEQVDALFRKAVAISFNKDLENGYRLHLADMSGGLDSRMVSWVARDLGFSDITNICYAQSQSQEWKAAFQVANALHNDFIYMPLDTCNFVYDVDEIVQQNYGLAVYIGITGGKRLLSYLNANVFGLEMTGMLGDVVIGAFIKKTGQNTAPTFNENRYSNLLRYDFDAAILREYENSEMFKLYTRGFLGAMSTYMIRNRFSDVASPFLDVEFFLILFELTP
ncbi:MAG TPA: hypothetical protein VHO48_07515, partial [Anaerolineaceae bacterium]|nr:hypothetical protein [Anaerolineaceae bacterium]